MKTLKEKALKKMAEVAMNSAKSSCAEVSRSGIHQPKQPEKLRRMMSK